MTEAIRTTTTTELANRHNPNYGLYLMQREAGLPASRAFQVIRDSMTRTKDANLPRAFISVAIGIAIFSIVRDIIDKTTGDYIWEHKIWITSPSGDTTRQVPLRLALRIIRKQGWEFADVEPIKPPRIISKREALKILLLGDKREDTL